MSQILIVVPGSLTIIKDTKMLVRLYLPLIRSTTLSKNSLTFSYNLDTL